ncbi:MAG TPA: hypothetical protein VJ821_00270 [Anaerolineales bacterium]|nr:hypothetical protein [Anaerolineales bacterium]
MPQNEIGWLLLIGAVFFLIGLLGGGVEISAIKIPSLSRYPRIAFSVVGALMLGLAVFRILAPTNAAINAPSVVATLPFSSTPTLPTTALSTEVAATATLFESPTVPPTENSNIVFSDDFESIPGVWTLGDEADENKTQNKSITRGKYMWQVSSIQPAIATQLPNAPIVSDFELQVELRVVSGADGTGYGVTFRTSDQARYTF